MATYTVKNKKVSDFKDPHGNSWVNVAFEGVGEPVVMVVKDPETVQEGKTFDGEIKEVQKKSGQGTYNRFFRDKPQDNNYSNQKREYTPRDDSAIQAQWAIGQANLQVVHGTIQPDQVEALAADFFAMIDRVKSGDKPEEDITGERVDLSEIPF